MQVFDNPSMLSQEIRFGGADLADIAMLTPPAVAARIAERFVSEHWDEIKKDSSLMAEAKKLAIEKLAEKISGQLKVELES